jgi:acetolactate synthase-1/2/3 large subunit
MAKICRFRWTKRVVDREALDEALGEFVASDGPALLEVVTDRQEALYPVVRPGTSYAEMELGPYIKEIMEK